MKFIYLDESGMGNEPVAVMVGVIVDAAHMRKAKEEWATQFERLRSLAKTDVQELKTSKFFKQKGTWSGTSLSDRVRFMEDTIDWFCQSSHKIVCSGIEVSRFNALSDGKELFEEIDNKWLFLAMHVALSVQKRYQGALSGNSKRRKLAPKGHCLLIFDEQHRERTKFQETLLDPPQWSDDYYGLVKGQEKMSQIVDVPHFVDSRHVGMVQLADLFSYIIRRSCELSANLAAPLFAEEAAVMNNLHAKLRGNMLPVSSNYARQNRSAVAEIFWSVAPNQIREYNPVII